jgi:hypothetical protein
MKSDIAAVLRTDHALLEQLSLELCECTRRSSAVTPVFRHFADVLGGHLTAMKKAVYPVLKSLGWKDVDSTLLVAHAELTHAFADLLTLQPRSVQFEGTLLHVIDAAMHVIVLERRHLLPLLERDLDRAQRWALGLEVQPYLGPLASGVAPSARMSASERLEEARVLFGSLPVRSA